MILAIQLLRVGPLADTPWGGNPLRDFEDVPSQARNALQAGDKIIFFGDSVLTTSASYDRDRRNLDEMLQTETPSCSIGRASHWGLGAGAFYDLSRQVLGAASPPEAVLLPINLRSFSVQWVRYNFSYTMYAARVAASPEPEASLLRAVFRPLQTLKLGEWLWTSTADFVRMRVRYGDEDIGSAADFEADEARAAVDDAALRRKLMYNYGYRLKADNRPFRALLSTARLFKGRSTKLVLYVTPIDYQLGLSLLGDSFRERIGETVGVLKRALAEEGAQVADFSREFPSDWFTWKDNRFPNEHLNAEGREHLARLIGRTLAAREVPCAALAKGVAESAPDRGHY